MKISVPNCNTNKQKEREKRKKRRQQRDKVFRSFTIKAYVKIIGNGTQKEKNI
jgi:hypothetical protein